MRPCSGSSPRRCPPRRAACRSTSRAPTPPRASQTSPATSTSASLIYNAALSPIGPFVEQSVEENLRAIDVNVKTPTAVAHHFVPRLVKRGRGGLVLLSSLTAFQGSPFVSTYGATKSFNLALAEGLWAELRGTGVDVISVCAGATATPNLLKATTAAPPGMLQPVDVVKEALDHLGAGPLFIPGRFNRFASFLMRRLMPRRTTIRIMGAQTRKLQLPP